MSTFGSLSIESDRAPWNSARSSAYLAVAAVGILAGILTAFARTPMHLPGHKALLWMAPIVAARLLTRTSGGASVGALATATTALILGGRIAGGVAMMPLVILAGLVLDISAGYGERHHFTWWKMGLLLAAAGVAGNLICLIKRLFDPMGSFWSVGNLEDLLMAGGWHGLFGFCAGLAGAGAAYLVSNLQRT
jgi:hypothetical protein